MTRGGKQLAERTSVATPGRLEEGRIAIFLNPVCIHLSLEQDAHRLSIVCLDCSRQRGEAL